MLTDHNRTQVAGISLVQAVSRQVARALAGPHPHAWAVSRSRCVTAHAGWSWRYAAGRVGLPAARSADVRRVSGGNPSPLDGQRVCSQTWAGPADVRTDRTDG